MSKLFKKHKASILGATLIILGIMLVSALSFSLVTIQERKASTGANKSSQALQTAGTGVELVMQAIKEHSSDNVNTLAVAAGATCTDGVISGNNFKVQLKDENDVPIDCNTSTAVALVRSVKSVGTADQNQRAVEVAVATSCEGGIKVIASSSGANFTPTDYTNIHNFVTRNEGELKGFWCKYPLNGSSTSYSNINNRVHFNDGGILFNAATNNSVGAEIGSFKCNGVCEYWWAGNGGSSCSSGWAVLGSCSCPSNSC